MVERKARCLAVVDGRAGIGAVGQMVTVAMEGLCYPPPPCGSVNPESDLLVHIYILRDWSTGGTTELLPPVYGLAKAP